MAEVSTAEIRAWAQENGYAVADRGRIPGAVLHAYEAAHATVRPPQQPADDDTRPEDALDAAEGTAPRRAQDDVVPVGGGTAPPPVPRQWSSDGRWGAPPPPPAPPAWGTAEHRSTWGPATQPPPPPSPAGTDVMAILALVFGIIPLMGGLLGIAFGISALKRISRSNQPGRGIAVAGIAAGSGWLVLIAGLFALGFVSGFGDAERAEDGAVIERGTLGAADLRPGDCLTSPPSGMTFTVRVVPCQEPHRAEVFGTFQLNGTGYPGDDEVKRFADGGCTEWLPVYVGAARADAFDIVYLRPTGESWRQGDREVTCVLKAPGDVELPPGSAKAP